MANTQRSQSSFNAMFLVSLFDILCRMLDSKGSESFSHLCLRDRGACWGKYVSVSFCTEKSRRSSG